ncbi:MAG TPA: acyl-CoA dehydrogenase family protein [Sandaracinaceae bacterium LLY-WYZ-13_1]|nr:acyl-CoA dehydrogenase family protein [Sandaracinaceae bacterium LLY-WYZ-13_1]
MSSDDERSFMKSIFHGLLEENLVFPYLEMDPEEKENVNLILENIRRFAESEVDSAQIDHDHEIPEALLTKMKEMGLFGLAIPEAHGGFGLSATAYARVIQEVAAFDASLAVTIGAHQSIGCKALVLFGTDEQKQKYLPALATGERVAAFALTEPGAGSDAASITTRAELDDDGTTYVLNGSKIWITNGGFADVFTVFARTSAPDPGVKPRITALIVERGEGLTNGPNEEKMGIRGSSTTEIFFEDVRVPTENVLGEAGRGFKVAMEVLNNGRLGLASGSLGACKRLLAMSTDRVQERQAFGRPIGEFGMIKEKIARMTAEIFALESMTYLTTGLIDAGVDDYSLESAICKVYGSETLWFVVNETLQIAAGIGYMSEYPYERMMRDARINMIFEGTNEILRAFIALSGMQSPGKQLAEVAKAMREPIKGFGLLREFAIHKARSMVSRERLERVHPVLRREAVIFEDGVAELAQAVEQALRKHGRDIAEMQFVQKRVAEVAMDLYALAAVLSRTTRAIERKGEAGATREIHLTHAFAQLAQPRLTDRLSAMERDRDELLKEVASQTYEDAGYPFDVV